MDVNENEAGELGTIMRRQSDRMRFANRRRNREYIHQVSPSGSQPCTRSTALCGGRLESQLAHHGDQVGLLDWLRDVRREEVLELGDLDPAAVRADSDYRCRRVLIVGTFDIPRSTFAINCV